MAGDYICTRCNFTGTKLEVKNHKCKKNKELHLGGISFNRPSFICTMDRGELTFDISYETNYFTLSQESVDMLLDFIKEQRNQDLVPEELKKKPNKKKLSRNFKRYVKAISKSGS